MKQNLKILRLKGQNTIPFIPELARLRIEMFKSYPYLSDGDLNYEHNYLSTYVKCSEGIVIIMK